MSARLLSIAGLNLDKPWPEEAVGVGPQLRTAGAHLLLEVAQRVIDLNVDAVVVHGGLWDTTAVRSDTVEEVQAVLSALTVPVVVVPDQIAAEAHHPEDAFEWPNNVRWVSSDGEVSLEVGDEHLVAIGPNWYGSVQPEDSICVLTSDGPTPRWPLPTVRRRPTPTPHSTWASAPVEREWGIAPGQDIWVPDLVQGSGGGRPRGLLIALETDQPPVIEDLLFNPDLGATRSLDIGAHADSHSLVAALDGLLETCSALDQVQVSGRVGPYVLVPPLLKWVPQRSDVTVVWEDLEHVFPPQSPERTVQAELIRRLSGPGPDVARRHQALALALASLDSAEAPA